MPRLLMVVSSARTLKLADGTDHPTGYWAEEVEKPYRRFIEQGVEVVVATPDGQPPQPDPYGLEPIFHYPDEDEDFAGSVFRSFAPDVDDIRLTLHHLTELNLMAARRVFLTLREAGLSAAEARGVVETCARRAWADDRDFIDVLAEEPVVAANIPADRLGMAWYLETALKNQGAVFDDGDSAWAPHIVVDRNLVTAQNPASSEAAADAVLKKLGVR